MTGRSRRRGWPDLVALRYAVRLNGITSLALTKLDILSSFDELPVCVRYRLPDGTETPDFPAHQSDFHHAEPSSRTVQGWRRSSARRADSRRPTGCGERLTSGTGRAGARESVVALRWERAQPRGGVSPGGDPVPPRHRSSDQDGSRLGRREGAPGRLRRARARARLEALAGSPGSTPLHAAPGNPGIARSATAIRSAPRTARACSTWRSLDIDLVVIGPEGRSSPASPTSYATRHRGLRAGRAAARIEGSKSFAKDVMTPPASRRPRRSPSPRPPCVVKADGLAAGKGVFVCRTADELDEGLAPPPPSRARS